MHPCVPLPSPSPAEAWRLQHRLRSRLKRCCTGQRPGALQEAAALRAPPAVGALRVDVQDQVCAARPYIALRREREPGGEGRVAAGQARPGQGGGWHVAEWVSHAVTSSSSAGRAHHQQLQIQQPGGSPPPQTVLLRVCMQRAGPRSAPNFGVGALCQLAGGRAAVRPSTAQSVTDVWHRLRRWRARVREHTPSPPHTHSGGRAVRETQRPGRTRVPPAIPPYLHQLHAALRRPRPPWALGFRV